MNKNAVQGRFCASKGFTLIELLVVVLIIGILAAVAVPQYRVAVEKTRVASLLPLLRNIVLAEQLYFMENGIYSTEFTPLNLEMPSGVTKSWKNAGKEALKYEGFMCDLTAFSAKCRLNDDMILETNYSKNSIECWAGTGNTLYNKVCRSLSGQDSVGTFAPGNKYIIR